MNLKQKYFEFSSVFRSTLLKYAPVGTLGNPATRFKASPFNCMNAMWKTLCFHFAPLSTRADGPVQSSGFLGLNFMEYC